MHSTTAPVTPTTGVAPRLSGRLVSPEGLLFTSFALRKVFPLPPIASPNAGPQEGSGYLSTSVLPVSLPALRATGVRFLPYRELYRGEPQPPRLHRERGVTG
jgi:hypothetical protein